MLASKELEEERKIICSNCDKSKVGICTQCGCIIKFKVKWIPHKCPLGKW